MYSSNTEVDIFIQKFSKMNSYTVHDLTGIKYLSGLIFVSSPTASHKGIDCSGMKNLEYLDMATTTSESINVSGCRKLIYLDADDIKKIIGLSSLANLEFLSVNRYSETAIDLSNYSRLKGLMCVQSKLTKLDLQQCPTIEFVDAKGSYDLVDVKASNCPSLKK